MLRVHSDSLLSLLFKEFLLEYEWPQSSDLVTKDLVIQVEAVYILGQYKSVVVQFQFEFQRGMSQYEFMIWKSRVN